MKERLNKILAQAGIASRRKSDKIIEKGRVKVNGKKITDLGYKADPKRDEIKVDDKIISLEKKVYILLNKPEGCVTTVDDPQGRQTVLDLIENVPQRIYPVGRLDYDTSGLLVLTNDGDITYILTHPSYEIEKKYLVEVNGRISDENIDKLENGIKLKDGLTAPADVKLLDRNNDMSIFTIKIHEGRNRQIRRMAKKIGNSVKSLKRISLAFLTIDDLSPGEYRFLSEEEIKRLKSLKNIK